MHPSVVYKPLGRRVTLRLNWIHAVCNIAEICTKYGLIRGSSNFEPDEKMRWRNFTAGEEVLRGFGFITPRVTEGSLGYCCQPLDPTANPVTVQVSIKHLKVGVQAQL